MESNRPMLVIHRPVPRGPCPPLFKTSSNILIAIHSYSSYSNNENTLTKQLFLTSKRKFKQSNFYNNVVNIGTCANIMGA